MERVESKNMKYRILAFLSEVKVGRSCGESLVKNKWKGQEQRVKWGRKRGDFAGEKKVKPVVKVPWILLKSAKTA